ncbi:MAG: type II toxin-antitoxin system VapC family toxin [Terrimicrobiaceae bacterium]
MGNRVLIDSGPLVAALSRRDHHHDWARSHFEAASRPFLTCEAVLSECFFLLERTGQGKEHLCALIDRGVVRLDFSMDQNLTDILRLIRRYKDTPMSLADACLVRMAEMHGNASVFTTDSDFQTYRKNERQIIPIIKP